MRIECITAETDRYLPVSFKTNMNKTSENTEVSEQKKNEVFTPEVNVDSDVINTAEYTAIDNNNSEKSVDEETQSDCTDIEYETEQTNVAESHESKMTATDENVLESTDVVSESDERDITSETESEVSDIDESVNPENDVKLYPNAKTGNESEEYIENQTDIHTVYEDKLSECIQISEEATISSETYSDNEIQDIAEETDTEINISESTESNTNMGEVTEKNNGGEIHVDNVDSNADDSEKTNIISEENNISGIFKEDQYEEEYGELVVPRIQKMSPPKKKCALKVKNSKEENLIKMGFSRNCTCNTYNKYRTNVINTHFQINGFIMMEASKVETIEGLKKLTYLLGDNYKYTAPFLKDIRKAICAPNATGERVIHFKFDKLSSGLYHKIAYLLKQYGLFTTYFINGNILTATISPVPRVIAYLNGKWLEYYSTFILKKVVSTYAKEHEYEYEILMNVKVAKITSPDIDAHEIDSVISIADKCFAFEVKSGNFDDYSTLYETRKQLHFVPDKYFLLSTCLDKETAETLQYFYEYFITGINGFEERLIEMINKAFAN